MEYTARLSIVIESTRSGPQCRQPSRAIEVRLRAIAFRRFQGPLTVEQLPDPVPPPHGVVVAVEATGLCRSDWHGWQGHDPDINIMPHVPGHEFAGRVVTVGREVRRWQGGERVTTPFVCGCGTCVPCRRGDNQV